MNTTTIPNPNHVSEIEELELAELDLGELNLTAIEQPAARSAMSNIDCTGLSSAQVATIDKAAATIRQHDRSAREAILAIGKELLIVKDLLGHGRFGEWLKAEFDWSEKTAQNYMSVARAFASAPAAAAQFPANVAYKIAAKSTPAPVRAAIIAEAASGKAPAPAEVVKRIEAATVKAGLAAVKPAVAAKQEDTGNVVSGPTLTPVVAAPVAASGKAAQAKPADKKQEAISRMVAMLQRQLGDEFADFQRMMAKVDPADFTDAVNKAKPLPAAVKEAA